MYMTVKWKVQNEIIWALGTGLDWARRVRYESQILRGMENKGVIVIITTVHDYDRTLNDWFEKKFKQTTPTYIFFSVQQFGAFTSASRIRNISFRYGSNTDESS